MPQNNLPESSSKRFQKNRQLAEKRLHRVSLTPRFQVSVPVATFQFWNNSDCTLSTLSRTDVCKTIIIRTPLPGGTGTMNQYLAQTNFETENFFQTPFKTEKGVRQPLYSLKSGAQAFSASLKTARH